MRAWLLERHGPPDVLRLVERADPSPAPGEVVVRVEAIGVNYAEVLSRRGLYGWAPGLPYVPGMEAAGRIEAVGEGVERAPGDAVVVGARQGAYATAMVVDEARALPAVEGFTVEENAAFPVNWATAWVGLVEVGRVRAGDRVLVSPAGGGVGTAAVQLARAHGCRVIAAAGSPAKLDRVRGLGADETVDYRSPGWEERLRAAAGEEGVDLALEMVGGEVFEAAKGVLAPFGLVVVAGYASLDYSWWNPRSWWRAWRGMPRMGLGEMLRRARGMASFHLGHLLPDVRLARSLWDELVPFVRRHDLRPRIGHRLSFQELPDAHRLIESRESFGKVVVRVEP